MTGQQRCLSEYICNERAHAIELCNTPIQAQRTFISLINLPHKRYRRTAEQLHGSMITIRIRTFVFVYAIMTFIVTVIEMVIQTTFSAVPQFDPNITWFLLIVYFVFTIYGVVIFTKRFTTVPDNFGNKQSSAKSFLKGGMV